MSGRILGKKLSSFQIIITGFLALILIGTLLLALPVSSKAHRWTSFETALFTSTSAVCVTGLVIKDTAVYWSVFGQIVILLLIQIGGLGIVSVTAFIATVSGKKISLLQRSLLQESISAYHVGGIVKMTSFVFRVAFVTELLGAVIMIPSFCRQFGLSGIWMAVFHSVSAFCNAGFDMMGEHTGMFSSLTFFRSSLGIIIPVCLLVIIGGIGFLSWSDIAVNRLHFRKYRMQSKVILLITAVLILIPAAVFFFNDFLAYELKERICLSVFQAITPRTAGFNTADLTSMSDAGQAMTIVLMLIGGSPGSTAGGMKTTTVAVVLANVAAVVHRRKSPQLFGRRIEDQVVKSAAALLVMYLFFALTGAFIISIVDNIPFPLCIFETSSAIGTVGLSLGITSSVSLPSHLILIVLMFLGRVGGLTLMFAAVSSDGAEVSQRPVEKIHVG